MLLDLAVSARDALLLTGRCIFEFGDRHTVQNYTAGMQQLNLLMRKLEAGPGSGIGRTGVTGEHRFG